MFFFFNQKTAYEMRISDCSSDVCSSDLLGDADGMICGTVGGYHDHLRFVDQVIGKKPNAQTYAAMNILLLDERTVALVDTHINDDPSAEQIAEFTIAAAEQMNRLNLEPKVAKIGRAHV